MVCLRSETPIIILKYVSRGFGYRSRCCGASFEGVERTEDTHGILIEHGLIILSNEMIEAIVVPEGAQARVVAYFGVVVEAPVESELERGEASVDVAHFRVAAGAVVLRELADLCGVVVLVAHALGLVCDDLVEDLERLLALVLVVQADGLLELLASLLIELTLLLVRVVLLLASCIAHIARLTLFLKACIAWIKRLQRRIVAVAAEQLQVHIAAAVLDGVLDHAVLLGVPDASSKRG